MYELLNIEVKDGRQLVSGRELHEFLEIGTRYDTWFRRMLEYGFIENQDFTLVVQKRSTNNPKNPWTEITDHAITLDMAKEICMLQRNEKGKFTRQYFIKCEKLTNQLSKYYDEKLAAITDRLDRTEKLIGLRTRTKFNYGKYIKNKVGINVATKEYENVKMVLFAELGVSMWEEIDYSLDVISKIDEILETLKLDNQITYIK